MTDSDIEDDRREAHELIEAMPLDDLMKAQRAMKDVEKALKRFLGAGKATIKLRAAELADAVTALRTVIDEDDD